jgi:RNA polymerase sigma-70 factor (ECF subfamily)
LKFEICLLKALVPEEERMEHSLGPPQATAAQSPCSRVNHAVRTLKEMREKIKAEPDRTRREQLEIACARLPEWRILYDHYSPKLDYLAFRFGMSNHDRDDVVQEIFVRVFRSLDTLAQVDKFDSWFRAVCYNEMYRFMGRSKRRRRVESSEKAPDDTAAEALPDPAPDQPSADDCSKHEQILQRLEDCIERLPPRMRQTLQLFCVQGHAQEEVAKIMQVAVCTVKEQLQRARKSLRACLQQYGFDK